MDQEFIWNLIAKKLSGEASESELSELHKELSQNPDLHYSLQAIYDLWKVNPVFPSSFAEKAFERHIKKMEGAGIIFQNDQEVAHLLPGKKFRSGKSMALAAIFILLVSGFMISVRFKTSKTNAKAGPIRKTASEIVTVNGSKTNLLLADGTKVWLNAGSKLSYDSSFGIASREISLSGEAYFDVVKNPSQPFIIHTGKVNIKVLGTSFNVKSYPGDKTFETSLIRGSIEVTFDNSAKKVILTPNQKLVVFNSVADGARKNPGLPVLGNQAFIQHLNHFGSDSLVTETAWVQNKLVFQDESFLELARQMERWYAIKIAFDNSQADTLHFTGSFSEENVSQAMNALQLTAPFKYKIQNDVIKITSNQN